MLRGVRRREGRSRRRAGDLPQGVDLRKEGRANKNRSWGNIRRARRSLDDKSFRIYLSWTAGAQDAARLLVKYGSNKIKPGTETSSVRTFLFVWAPSADGNIPDAYGISLAQWIGEWSAAFPAKEAIKVYLFGLERWFMDGSRPPGHDAGHAYQR